MTILLLLTAAGWAALACVAWLGERALADLPSSESVDLSAETVTAVMPARDEAERIERSVEGLLAQRGVALQLVVVDDGSTDATPELLLRLQARHERLRVVRVDRVPEGWLGKCHACSIGAAEVRDGWLLFVDADTWCAPDVVRRAVAAARRSEAMHLCLLPGLGDCTFAGRAVVLFASLGMLGMSLGANRDRRFGHAGVGAFTFLVDSAAYRSVGGHAALRHEVVEDFALAQRMRSAGYRSRLLLAARDVEVRWAYSAASFVRVLEKNMFAKLGFSVTRLLVQSTLLSAAFALPLAGVVIGSWPGFSAFAAMMLAAVPAGVMARRYGFGIAAGLAAPFAVPLVVFAGLHSARTVLRDGGVRWRGTTYPLAELRKPRGDARQPL